MTDIVKRLRAPANWLRQDKGVGWKDAINRYDRTPFEAANEIERLKVKNIQMQAALGYAICADDERHIIPENPFRCGVCDANKGIHAEIERLRAALREIDEIGRIAAQVPGPRNKLMEICAAARAALGGRDD